MPALVVSLDGPDFSGKTTIANLALELLREFNKGKDILFKRTTIPSSLITGTSISFLRNSNEKFSPEVFSLVYAADHLHHYLTQIKPLKEDKEKSFIVLQERSLLSTLLYQGVIGGVDLNWIREINKFDKNTPDLTLILKINIEELLRRKEIEKKQFDRFETSEHLKKQVDSYYNLPENLVKEFNVEYIDGNDAPLIVASRCAKRIQKEIDKRFG